MDGDLKSPKTTLVRSLTDDEVYGRPPTSLVIGTAIGSTQVLSGHAHFIIFRKKTAPYVRRFGF